MTDNDITERVVVLLMNELGIDEDDAKELAQKMKDNGLLNGENNDR